MKDKNDTHFFGLRSLWVSNFSSNFSHSVEEFMGVQFFSFMGVQFFSFFFLFPILLHCIHLRLSTVFCPRRGIHLGKWPVKENKSAYAAYALSRPGAY